jgi:hypothetical protein
MEIELVVHILMVIKNVLYMSEFIERHKIYETDFTRNRKLPFHLLICFIVNSVKGSYQAELDRFFQAVTRSSFAKRVVSKAAFAKARMKLKYEAFIELNRILVAEFSSTFQLYTWHGFRLLAIDGTTLTLPNILSIIEHFGAWNGRRGDPCPKARASQLFDVLNGITISALISPKCVGEREQAKQLLSGMPANSLVLLDRGYPAFWLFKLILSLKGHFCARISCTSKVVKKFANSMKKEKIIDLKASTSAGKCKELGLDIKPIKLRLIRIQLSTGEFEILITSLIDKAAYPFEIFGELYHKRWPVEEDYKKLKCRIEVEAFSGQSCLSVYQDFHASVFAKNLVSVITFPARKELESTGVKQKHPHQINFASVIGKAKNFLAILFQRTISTIKTLVQEFVETVLKTTEPVRPGRKYPRKHRNVRRKHFQNYKPVC